MASPSLLRSSASACSTSGRVAAPLALRPSRASSVRVSASASGTSGPSSSVKPPAGVSMPPQQPQVPAPMFGFVNNAEIINSRACMIGFFALLLVEAVTSTPLLTLMGWRIGSGLGFEL